MLFPTRQRKMKIVLTPDWFLGKDVLIDIFSFIILFAFFILCFNYNKLSKKKGFLFLGIGFLLVAIAQLATILTKLVLYYDTTLTQQIGQIIVTYNIVKSVDIFYYAGFFFHKFLTLIGLYIIYRIPKKRIITEEFFLIAIFLAISALFSKDAYYLYHLVAFLLLVLIIKNYYFLYQKNKSANTITLVSAFFLLAVSQLIFIFSKLSSMFVLANLIELVSYLILLVLIIRIIRSKS